MIAKKIHFKMFAGEMDVSLAELAIAQLKSESVQIELSFPDKFQINPGDVVILAVKTLEESFLNDAIDARNSTSNRFVVITDSSEIILASTLSRLGFNDFYVFPYELQKFKSLLNEIIDNLKYVETDGKNKNGIGSLDFQSIIGSSSTLLDTIRMAKKVSETPNINALILGETGTGKGLLARTIHESSPKASSPFIDIICTAIPTNLLESELFGYERGAFTDAKERKIGLMELAEDGTLFMDEIGDLNLEIQSKLLKALDTKTVRRLGGTEDIPIDARIIAATNRDLNKLVQEKEFRADLYHRLNVISIQLPPLRDRGEDIMILTKHFIEEHSKKFGKKINRIEPEANNFIKNYDWPGNVRELRNALERAVLLAESDTLMLKDLFNTNMDKLTGKVQKISNQINLEIDYEHTQLTELEVIFAKEVFEKMNGNKSKTAKILGISRPKLDKLLKGIT